MLTFGSLFAGVGGMDLGFERAGMRCVWQVEIDPYCRRVLAKHWPDVRRHDDVKTFPTTDQDWTCDVICGGDPCQANSAASSGNSRAESLGGEFVRVVGELRPRVVVRENPAHVLANAPWPWQRMRSALESLGYAVLPFRLRACCFGALHQRERMFLLAEAADANGNRLAWREAEAATECSRRAAAGPLHANDWAALHAPRGMRSRAGFPHYVDRMRAIGNSVYPAVAEWIARRIVEAQG